MVGNNIAAMLEVDYRAGTERSARFAELEGYYVIWSGENFVDTQWFLNFNFNRLLRGDPKFKGFVGAAINESQLGKFSAFPMVTPLDFMRRRRKGERIGLVHFFTSKAEEVFFRAMGADMFSFICALHSKGLAHTYVPVEDERSFVLENIGRYVDIIERFEDETSRRMMVARLRSIMTLDMTHIIHNNYPLQFEYFNALTDEFSFKLKDQEIFCDVGASWGDCVVRFAESVKDLSGSKIYAFEPNDKEFNTLRTLQAVLPLKADNAIVSNVTGNGYFLTVDENVQGSRITTTGASADARRTVRLDDVCEKLTLIKIDAEGAEPSILEGALRILSDPECRLTSCIYHYPADLFKTIDVMKSVGRERFFFRQHNATLWDGLVYFH